MGRSPHGERGLKWRVRRQIGRRTRRSPHGERGLKYKPIAETAQHDSRSPHGERGLKYDLEPKKSKVLYVALLTESVD